MTQITTYEDAVKDGRKRYYTGTVCSQGHDSERFTSTKRCCECKRLENLADRDRVYPDRRPHAKPVDGVILSRKEKALKHYKDNREKIIARSILWKASHPESARAHKQNRRAKQRASGGRLSTGLARRLLVLQKSRCACCKEKIDQRGYHLDHIMPLALDGENVDSNIQLLCPPCNRNKHAKHPVDFMQSRGFLI